MGRILGAATVVAAMVGTLLAGVAPAAHADQTTAGVDSLRTNWDQSEPALSPAAVQSSSFGQLFRTPLDGQVYAQPLVIGNEVVAVTENNTAYGMDAATGAVSWSVHYGTPFPASAINCGDLTPNLGATATPVYDPSTSTLYFTTKVDDGTATHLHPTWLMHAVDPSSGAEKAGWPVTIAGAASNQPGVTFDPYYEQQRPGLLLLNGTVYAGFGGHCDKQPYRGYVVGVSTTTHSITAMWASEAGASTSGAGIWQSGGGLVSDGNGRIFFSTGNGISPSAGPGNGNPGTLAESVVRLQVGADGSLSTADFFSPTNNATLDLQDKDISSGAPMALPDGYGTAAHPHLLVQQGKDGRVFLLDRDNLGGMGQGPGGTNNVVGITGPYQGLWGHPAFWGGGNGGYVYLIGNGGPLRALHVGVAGNGNPALTLTGQSQDVFGYTSGSPLVTSSGTSDGSAVLWMVSADNASGANGTLRAYAATPDGNGLLQLLWSAPVGTAAKFATPSASNGRIYVGTRDGFLYGFGSPAATALTASPVDFGMVPVGGTSSATLHLTAAAAGGVTVNSWSTSTPFGIGSGAPAAPVTLAQNQTLDIPVTYAPTTTGGANGVVTLMLGNQKLVFALHGIGTRPGLGAAPAALAFGQVPTGTSLTMNVQLTNTGTDPETVSATTAPTAPFTATGIPATGTVVQPGNSVVVSVAYTPTAASAGDASSLAITSTNGTVTVPLSGSAVVGRGHLTFSTATTDFGTVPVGASSTQAFTITNDGNLPVTVTKAKAPTGDYNSAQQLSEGLIIGPGQSAVQRVTFTPRAAGTITSAYEITGDGQNPDGSSQGAMFEQLTGQGSGVADVTDVQSALWQANGSAVLPGDGSIQLTGATNFQAGSAFYTAPLRTAGLRATFTATLNGGSGGDGLAFDLLDPARAKPTAVGGNGGGVGAVGLPAVAVVLRTTNDPAARLPNFVALAVSAPGATKLTYLAATVLPMALRQGTHQIDVQVAGGQVLVSVDGIQEINNSAAVLPAQAYVGFSGGTGALNDVHAVSGVVVSAGPSVGFTPVAPARALATWAGVGHAGTAPIPAGGTDTVAVGGAFGVPADASAALVEVTATGPTATSGSLTVWPHGGTRPAHGTVQWNQAGQTVVQQTVVQLGQGGQIDLVNGSGGTAQAQVYVLGYYAPGRGSGVTAIPAATVLDTTSGLGTSGTAPLAGHGTLTMRTTNLPKVPATAAGLLLDVTVSRQTSDGSLSVFQHGAARPGFADLSWTRSSDDMSTLLSIPTGPSGALDLYNWGTGTVAVNVVVVGWYGAPAGSGAPGAGVGAGFVATTPTLLLDTNAGVGQAGTARMPAGGTATLGVSAAGIPAGARAVLVDLGSNGSTTWGGLTAWPVGGTTPGAPAFYWNVPGHSCNDVALVPLNASGQIVLRNGAAAPASVYAEVLGYFS